MGFVSTGHDGHLAAEFRDERLSAVFPAVLVCTAEGALLDADQDGTTLLPHESRAGGWLDELLASAGSIGPEPVSVHTQDPPTEGVAWTARGDEGDVCVLHLRDPRTSAAMADIADEARRFGAVLRCGPLIVQIVDEHMNPRWESATLRPELGHDNAPGMSSEERLSYVHPDDVPGILEDRERMSRGEERLGRRIRVRDADGNWRWLEMLRSRLPDEPELGFSVVYSWEVTEQVERELEVESGRRRLEALIHELDEAVLVASGDRVQLVNPTFVELFPFLGTADDLPGRPIAEIEREIAQTTVHPSGFLAALGHEQTAGDRVRDRILALKDGRTIELNVLIVDVEGRHSRMWVARDITAQRKAELQRERSLAMERGSRRRAEEQIRRLRELDQLKDEIVATVSHELRTPLSAVSSYLEMLIEDEAAIPAAQREFVRAAGRGVDQLKRLVDDLLVLARLETRSLPVERHPVDVADAVGQAVENVRLGSPAAADVAMTCEADQGPAWTGDRLRLEQIVTNLLVNAVRFARTRVACRASATSSAWVIDIIDDGPGVPVDERDRIFERFARGTGGRQTSTGAGLGLPISRRLAEVLGGSLELVEPAGQHASGATFRITLPLGGPPAE